MESIEIMSLLVYFNSN